MILEKDHLVNQVEAIEKREIAKNLLSLHLNS